MFHIVIRDDNDFGNEVDLYIAAPNQTEAIISALHEYDIEDTWGDPDEFDVMISELREGKEGYTISEILSYYNYELLLAIDEKEVA